VGDEQEQVDDRPEREGRPGHPPPCDAQTSLQGITQRERRGRIVSLGGVRNAAAEEVRDVVHDAGSYPDQEGRRRAAGGPGVTPAAPRLAAFVLGAIALAAALRWSVRDYVTGDVAFWVSYWYEHLKDHGLAAFRGELPNDDGWAELRGSYPPTYYYLLWIASWFDRWAPRLYLIKAVSVTFDVVAAVFAYRIAGLLPQPTRFRSWASAVLVLLAPTLILNSSFWGQCDAIHVSMLLGAIYFSLSGRPVATVACFALALSVKAQAIFLAPYLLVLILRSRLRWSHLLVVPVVYAAVMSPAVLLGRPVLEILAIYPNQADFLRGLSLNAANLYYFVDNEHYATGVLLGSALTVAVSLLYAVRAGRSPTPDGPRFLLICALTAVALAPFTLPKMHDRYFLAADLVSLLVAVADPRLWYLAIGFQVTSLLAYLPVVTDTVTGFGGEFVALMPVAVVLNCLLIVELVRVFWRATSAAGDSTR
jgi:Gpi18-like mannosyltransferase